MIVSFTSRFPRLRNCRIASRYSHREIAGHRRSRYRASIQRPFMRRTNTRLMSRGGVVTSTWIGAARGLEGPLISGRGGGSPRPERFVSEDAKRAAGCEMALDVESVLEGGMNGQKALS